MAEKHRKFDLNNPSDITALQNLLWDNNDDDQENFDDESDTDCEAVEEARSEDSDTTQSSTSTDEETEDNAYPHYTGRDGVTKWKKIRPTQQRRMRSQNLLMHLPGVKGPAKACKTPFESWNVLITSDMLDMIVQYTNQYIESIRQNYGRDRDAKCTDKVEIKAFLGLLYLAGVLRSNRMSLEELWGTDGDGIEIFHLVMNLKRFKFLIRCLRFDDRTTREERRQLDRLASIRDIFTAFVGNCQKCYSLGENVTIDEMLVGFKGRCCFIQYIPSKPNKYGIKIYSLVDARIFYSYNMEIYAGKQPEGPLCSSNKPSDVVKRLAQPIYKSGRNITADNWFTDFNLVNDLQKLRLSYVGTLKKNKRVIPTEFVSLKDRPEHSSIFGFREEATIVSYIPKKNKNVLLISSQHFDNSIDEATGEKQKPEIITFYNETKSGVDVVDKMCATYNVARNCRRWPLVVFFAMLNICGINSQIIYLGNRNEIKSRRLFLKKLSRELVSDQLSRRSMIARGIPRPLQRNLLKFQPVNTEELLSTSEGGKRRRCTTCTLETKKTRISKYSCKSCNDYFCLEHAVMICKKCDTSLHCSTSACEQD